MDTAQCLTGPKVIQLLKTLRDQQHGLMRALHRYLAQYQRFRLRTHGNPTRQMSCRDVEVQTDGEEEDDRRRKNEDVNKSNQMLSRCADNLSRNTLVRTNTLPSIMTKEANTFHYQVHNAPGQSLCCQLGQHHAPLRSLGGER